MMEKRYFQRTLDFFPGIGNDASKVTWAHAVNSQIKLREAVDSSIMFIEADILLDSSTNEAIMAHPPHTTSDLTFAQFLREAQNASKGLKLDFKDIHALSQCLVELEKQKDNISGPVMLNADIVRLNHSCAKPMDPERFLRECLTFGFRVRPQLTLSFSLGWTTIYDRKTTMYTWSSVLDMYRTITNNENYALFHFELTFPVRLSLALESFDQLHWLSTVTKSGLTFWSPTDEVEPTQENLNKLFKYRSLFNHSLIYFDLPPPFDHIIEQHQIDRIDEKESFPSMKDHWHPTVGQEDDVLVSDYSAMITKSNVYLRTKQTFDSTTACRWSGRIDFLEDVRSHAQAVLCYLSETEHNSKAGMTITLSKGGCITLNYENSQGSSQIEEYFVVPSSSYSFEISDAVSKMHMEVASLSIEASSSIPTSTQLTLFLDTRRQRATTDENKSFRAAVMGLNLEQTHSTAAIIFSHLRLTQDSQT